jgi:hypothetical protein
VFASASNKQTLQPKLEPTLLKYYALLYLNVKRSSLLQQVDDKSRSRVLSDFLMVSQNFYFSFSTKKSFFLHVANVIKL